MIIYLVVIYLFVVLICWDFGYGVDVVWCGVGNIGFISVSWFFRILEGILLF